MAELWLIAATNLLSLRILDKLGKTKEELRLTNIVVTGYRGKSTSTEGVVLLNVKVGTMERPTLFIVIPSKSSYPTTCCLFEIGYMELELGLPLSTKI